MAPVATETPDTTVTPPMDFAASFAAAKETHTPTPDPPVEEKKVEAPVVAAEVKPDEPTVEELVPASDLEALKTKYADDPMGLVKELNRVFTQKTQAVAADRKTYEKLKPYSELIDAFEANGEGTLAALAEQYGFTLAPKAAPEGGDGKPTDAKAPASGPLNVDEIVAKFTEALGPEADYLGEQLGPAVKVLVEAVTKSVESRLEKTVKPLQDQQASILNKTAQDQTDQVMKTFGDTHPDWKEHEPEMLSLSETLQPNGLTETEYLDRLYQLATRASWEKDRDAKIADAVKTALAKMTKGAESDERRPSTPEGRVQVGPPGGRPASFREAADAAKRGERWE